MLLPIAGKYAAYAVDHDDLFAINAVLITSHRPALLNFVLPLSAPVMMHPIWDNRSFAFPDYPFQPQLRSGIFHDFGF